MEVERTIARYRRWYRRLLCCYSRPHRERFGQSMEQSFNDLCRERAEKGKGLFGFALWMFLETCSGVVRENARAFMRFSMSQNSALSLRIVKYAATTLSILMLAGIALLMFLARGTGEDITGIVAPALLITFLSAVVATIIAVIQKRERQRSNSPR